MYIYKKMCIEEEKKKESSLFAHFVTFQLGVIWGAVLVCAFSPKKPRMYFCSENEPRGGD